MSITAALLGCEGAASSHETVISQPSEALVPDLRIDGYSADLVPVTWMGVSPNGTIALLQMQDARVRFFDSLGHDLGSFGRSGSGPGEFRRPVRGGWIADTLWMSDSELDRITLISPERNLVRTLQMPRGAEPDAANVGRLPAFSYVFPYGLLPGDVRIATATGVEGDPGGTIFRGTPVIRVSSEDKIEGLVTEIPPNPCSINVVFQGGSAGSQVPFCSSPQWVISSDGQHALMVVTNVTGRGGGSFTVSLVETKSATMIFSDEIPFEGVPIPPATVDSAIDDRASRAPVAELRQAIESQARDLVPPVYPPVRGIFVGGDKRVWVGLRTEARGNPYIVLSAEGEISDRVLVPANVTLRVADAQHAWGLERDDLGVESVVRFSLAERD